MSVCEYFAGGVINQTKKKNLTKKSLGLPFSHVQPRFLLCLDPEWGRERSLLLRHTEMQRVFVLCYQQRAVMSLLARSIHENLFFLLLWVRSDAQWFGTVIKDLKFSLQNWKNPPFSFAFVIKWYFSCQGAHPETRFNNISVYYM